MKIDRNSKKKHFPILIGNPKLVYFAIIILNVHAVHDLYILMYTVSAILRLHLQANMSSYILIFTLNKQDIQSVQLLMSL